tara:strand:- start:2912 stop:3124 length:213 start_codon:yes stop_codon:yes gene_type:complete
MIEERRTARGSAIGIKLAVAKNNSSSTVNESSPLPTISSIYTHINCITRINRVMKKVRIKGPRKVFITSM